LEVSVVFLKKSWEKVFARKKKKRLRDLGREKIVCIREKKKTPGRGGGGLTRKGKKWRA